MPEKKQVSVGLTQNEAALLYEVIDARIQRIAKEGIETTASAKAFRDGLRKKLADAISKITRQES